MTGVQSYLTDVRHSMQLLATIQIIYAVVLVTGCFYWKDSALVKTLILGLALALLRLVLELLNIHGTFGLSLINVSSMLLASVAGALRLCMGHLKIKKINGSGVIDFGWRGINDSDPIGSILDGKANYSDNPLASLLRQSRLWA